MHKQKLPCLVWTVVGTKLFILHTIRCLDFIAQQMEIFIEKNDEQVSEIIESHLGEE